VRFAHHSRKNVDEKSWSLATLGSSESRELPGSSNRSFARMLVDFLMDDLRWRVLSRPLCRDGTARGMSD